MKNTEIYEKLEKEEKILYTETANVNRTNINWYPGHMAKAKKEITNDLKLIDVVIEILDSRIPISSQNPDIAELTKNKDKIIILNKSDLADTIQNNLWVEYFKSKGQVAILADCNIGKGINEVLRAVEKLKQKDLEIYAQKGRTGKKIRIMVLRNTKCWKIFFYK